MSSDPAEDSAWMFDSLIGFLLGPIWTAPVLTFIEEKSAIFNAHSGNEHEEEYRQTYENYRSLVDTMLNSFMEDLGITPEQFQEICSQRNAEEGSQIHHHRSLFEQVWAAEDYEIFKHMMMQKNLELQMQTLELIRRLSNTVPDSYKDVKFSDLAVGDPSGSEDALAAEEARILDEVIKKSKEEYETTREELDEGTLALQQRLSQPEEMRRLQDECRRERQRLHTAISVKIDIPEAEETSQEEVQKEEVPEEEKPEDLAERQAYLQAQRDKLLALKKQERQRALEEADASAQTQELAQTQAQSQIPVQRGVSARTLSVRRALADRLKAEVVGNL